MLVFYRAALLAGAALTLGERTVNKPFCLPAVLAASFWRREHSIALTGA